jgi:DNA invertase Pin-like site-specific DNA recombinase
MGTRARIWLLVSTDGQNEESQLPDVLAWCESHAYEVAGEPYQLHGDSAFKGNHVAELQRALGDMAAGEYDVLVAWKSDRIDRQEKLGHRMAQARDNGGRIEFAREAEINQANEMLAGLAALPGKMTVLFREALNYQESKDKSDRSCSRLASPRQAAPYGAVPLRATQLPASSTARASCRPTNAPQSRLSSSA